MKIKFSFQTLKMTRDATQTFGLLSPFKKSIRLYRVLVVAIFMATFVIGNVVVTAPAVSAQAKQASQVCKEDEKKEETGCTSIDCAPENNEALTKENCQIVAYIVIAINFLTAVAGLAITSGVVYGGYLYLTARDNPGQVQAGRSKIVWALVALLLLIFGYSGMQWLVPGGVL